MLWSEWITMADDDFWKGVAVGGGIVGAIISVIALINHVCNAKKQEERIQNLELRVIRIEDRIANVENRILDFQSTFHETKADMEYHYSLLKKEITQLKQTSLTAEEKQELDAWLDFLETIRRQKTQEREVPREVPITYRV